jgi:hypothetical protein
MHQLYSYVQAIGSRKLKSIPPFITPPQHLEYAQLLVGPFSLSHTSFHINILEPACIKEGKLLCAEQGSLRCLGLFLVPSVLFCRYSLLCLNEYG